MRISVLLCISLVALFAFYIEPLARIHLHSDLYNYWALTQQFLKGISPYDFEQLTSNAEYEVGPAYFGPWIFPILTPILAYPFQVSVFVYLTFTTLLMLLLSVLASRLFVTKKVSIDSACLSGLLFLPMIETFAYGQWSILITALGYGALLAYRSERYFLCGALLAGATFKPHLCFLVWTALLITVFHKRQWSVLIGGLSTVGFFAGIAELIAPGITFNWLTSFHSSMGWKSASIIMPIRLLFATPEDPYPALPAIVIPLGLMWGVATFFSWNKERTFLSYLPHLLSLSCITAPYIWPFDYTVLIGVHLAILHNSSARTPGPRLPSILLILANIGLAAHFFIQDELQKLSTFWFPIALLYLWIKVKNSLVAASHKLRDCT